MSYRVDLIGHWDFGLDLAFDIGHWSLGLIYLLFNNNPNLIMCVNFHRYSDLVFTV